MSRCQQAATASIEGGSDLGTEQQYYHIVVGTREASKEYSPALDRNGFT
ncbi:MAG: hypothetical protein MI756_09830 [Chromatiales bacterium]|nr:hypothetical protein [Chromatiales bacterium]